MNLCTHKGIVCPAVSLWTCMDLSIQRRTQKRGLTAQNGGRANQQVLFSLRTSQCSVDLEKI